MIESIPPYICIHACFSIVDVFHHSICVGNRGKKYNILDMLTNTQICVNRVMIYRLFNNLCCLCLSQENIVCTCQLFVKISRGNRSKIGYECYIELGNIHSHIQ